MSGATQRHRRTESIDIERIGPRTYRTSHDLTRGGLSVTLTLALEEVSDGVEAAQLIPELASYVDPDALDRLFRARADGRPRADGGRLELTIEGYEVTIRSDGEITIREGPDAG